MTTNHENLIAHKNRVLNNQPYNKKHKYGDSKPNIEPQYAYSLSIGKIDSRYFGGIFFYR